MCRGMTAEEEAHVRELLGQGAAGTDDAPLSDPPPVSVVPGEGYGVLPEDAVRLAHIQARVSLFCFFSFLSCPCAPPSCS